MKEWILSIVGMAFLGVVIETIIPNGKLNMFIKSMFALFLLFIIVSPLPKIFNQSISFDTSFDYEEDVSFLNKLNEKKLENYELSIKEQLIALGISNINIQFEADTTKSDFKVQKIYVDVCNIVLNDVDKHINITDTILKVVTSTLGITDKEVIIYGR